MHSLLQDGKVDVNDADLFGETALLKAAKQGRRNVVDALIRCDDERSSPPLQPPPPQKRKKNISNKVKKISHQCRRNFFLLQIVKNLLGRIYRIGRIYMYV